MDNREAEGVENMDVENVAQDARVSQLVPEGVPAGMSRAAAIKTISAMRRIGGNATVSKLREQTGYSTGYLHNVISHLRSIGVVEKVGKENGETERGGHRSIYGLNEDVARWLGNANGTVDDTGGDTMFDHGLDIMDIVEAIPAEGHAEVSDVADHTGNPNHRRVRAALEDLEGLGIVQSKVSYVLTERGKRAKNAASAFHDAVFRRGESVRRHGDPPEDEEQE